MTRIWRELEELIKNVSTTVPRKILDLEDLSDLGLIKVLDKANDLIWRMYEKHLIVEPPCVLLLGLTSLPGAETGMHLVSMYEWLLVNGRL